MTANIIFRFTFNSNYKGNISYILKNAEYALKASTPVASKYFLPAFEIDDPLIKKLPIKNKINNNINIEKKRLPFPNELFIMDTISLFNLFTFGLTWLAR